MWGVKIRMGNKTKKPYGYWKDSNNYFRELDEAIEKNGGERPKQEWLNDNGFTGICSNSNHFGGLKNVLDDRFPEVRKSNDYWKDPKNFYNELREAIEVNNGKRPSWHWLGKNGYSSLAKNSKNFGGLSNVLNEFFEEKGYKPDRYWSNRKNFDKEMEKAINENGGKRPNCNWLKRNGYSGLVRTAKIYGGILRLFDDRFGESDRKPKGYWRKKDNFYRELEGAIKDNDGERPSNKWLSDNGYYGIVKNASLFAPSLRNILDGYFSDESDKDPLKSLLEEYIGEENEIL